jgi:hypothetical protein
MSKLPTAAELMVPAGAIGAKRPGGNPSATPPAYALPADCPAARALLRDGVSTATVLALGHHCVRLR